MSPVSCLNNGLHAAVALLFLAAPLSASANAPRANEYLELDISQLMNITITSVSKKKQSLADVAAAVFVITQEDIRRSGASTLPDLLAMAPGIQVAKINSSKWSVSARGFAGYTSNKLLVLIDGRSVYSPAYSGVFWDMQNTLVEDIDRIEVIRGPGGTIWGANAVNGVINIITKRAQDTDGGLARLSLGNEQINGALRYGAKLGEYAHGRAYVQYAKEEGNLLAANQQDAEDEWRPLQGGFRLDGGGDGKTEWTLQGDAYQNDGQQIISPQWLNHPPYLTSSLEKNRNIGANVLGRIHHQFDSNQALSFQAYYDYTNRDEHFYQIGFDILDLDLQYERKLGQNHNLSLGAGYRSVWADSSETFQVRLPGRRDELYSAFAQDAISLLSDSLTLTLGVKYEHNQYTHSEWQPSARLLWKPADRHALWLAAARAVRTPAMVERSGQVLLGMYPSPRGMLPLYLAGNDQFQSEIVHAYEGGYRWQASEQLMLDLALFYNEYQDGMGGKQVFSQQGLGNVFANIMEGQTKGLEASVEWKPMDALSFALAYTYLDMDLRNRLTEEQDIRTKDSTPQHQLSLRSSYAFADNWRFNLWLRAQDGCINRVVSAQGAQQFAIDSALTVDANIIWTPQKNLELMFAAQNLGDASRLHYVSEYATPATEIERAAYGKLTWRF